MFPSVDDRHRMLGIMVGVDQKDSYAVRKTVKTPQVQPVVVQRPVYGPDNAENCLELPQVQYWGRHCDHAAHVPAVRLDSWGFSVRSTDKVLKD